MTYSTFTKELLLTFPDIEQFSGLEYLDGEDLPYVWFGSGLIPMLEDALRLKDAAVIGKILSFVEQVSIASERDPGLAELVGIEFGEWLNEEGTWESTLESQIGPVTRKVINYVPGLGTQRKMMRDEAHGRSLMVRIGSWFRGSRKRK